MKDTDPRIIESAGNSPLQRIPADYHPSGAARWFVLQDGPDAGKRMFFYEEVHGNGEPEATIVLVHGNPECSYAYRKVIASLSRAASKPYRIVVMDHIGFGLSDQASFEMVEMHHADNLRQLVRHLDLQKVTLVVHDWGGPIGVGAFIEDPHRVSALVVTNTTVFPMPSDGLTFTNFPLSWYPWCVTADVVPWKSWGAHAAFAVTAEPPSSAFALLLKNVLFHIGAAFGYVGQRERSARSVYLQQFKSHMNVQSSKRMVRQTQVWGHGYIYVDRKQGRQCNSAFYQRIQDRISDVWGPNGRNIPVRMELGKWDPLAKPSVQRQWVEALPQLAGHINVYENASHFVSETKGEEVARAIVDAAGLKG